MNYKLLIQYDGSDFHGWQVQENARTIQGELERVIGSLVGAPVKVAGSGRTDAGVHAEGQVANVKLDPPWAPEKLRNAINGNLWRDIRIINVEKADEGFHARFSARGKTYAYRIVNAPVMSPFWRRFALHETRPLDIARMTEASRFLLGEHDWTAFSSALSESENKVRTVMDCRLESIWDKRAGMNIIEFQIRANGFLRYMVRSIMGTLLEIGRGEKPLDLVLSALSSGDRSLAGQTAQACGLTLVKVDYN